MARLAVLPIYLLLLALGRASSTNTTQDFGPATKAELSCQGDNGGKSTTVKSLKDCQDHCRKYGVASPDKEGPLCHCGNEFACAYDVASANTTAASKAAATAPVAATPSPPTSSPLICRDKSDDIEDGCPCRTRRNLYGSSVEQPEYCRSDCCDSGRCADSDECTTEQVMGYIWTGICLCCCCAGGATLLFFAMGGNQQHEQGVYRDSYAGNGTGFEREITYADPTPQYNDVVATAAPPAYSASPGTTYTAQPAAI